jgi:uncharacterized protein YukE
MYYSKGGDMPDVRMDFDLMRQMVKTIMEANDSLRELVGRLDNILADQSDSIYMGASGTGFYDYVRDALKPQASLLEQSFFELAMDVNGARAALEDGDRSAASRFH